MTDTDKTAEASDALARSVFFYTMLGAATFIGAVIVFVL